MPVLPPTASPRAALRDLSAFLRQRSREQVWAAIMALLVTLIIVIVFFVDAKVNTAPLETVTYVKNYENRTDAQIIAEQKVEKERTDKFKAERRRQFKELGKRLHLD